jgi:hypothetical protein
LAASTHYVFGGPSAGGLVTTRFDKELPEAQTGSHWTISDFTDG